TWHVAALRAVSNCSGDVKTSLTQPAAEVADFHASRIEPHPLDIDPWSGSYNVCCWRLSDSETTYVDQSDESELRALFQNPARAATLRTFSSRSAGVGSRTIHLRSTNASTQACALRCCTS